jgi:hypothetical protein
MNKQEIIEQVQDDLTMLGEDIVQRTESTLYYDDYTVDITITKTPTTTDKG